MKRDETANPTVAVCCSVLQCVAVCVACVAVCCSVLQCVAVCCCVLQCGAAYCSVLQCCAVCYDVLHRGVKRGETATPVVVALCNVL